MSKKKYSINWENDEPASFEVNGVTYNSLEDIPNVKDRDKLSVMVQAASEDEPEEVNFNSQEFKELRKAAESTSMERWVLGGFSAIAAIMLLVSFISIFLNIQKLGKEESTPGRVVDVVVRRETVNLQDHIIRDYYYPVVQFVAIDGRKRVLQMRTGSDSDYYEKGDEVTVAYDPAHPLDARIKSAGNSALMWILPAITGVLGIAFAGAVWVVKKVMSI